MPSHGLRSGLPAKNVARHGRRRAALRRELHRELPQPVSNHLQKARRLQDVGNSTMVCKHQANRTTGTRVRRLQQLKAENTTRDSEGDQPEPERRRTCGVLGWQEMTRVVTAPESIRSFVEDRKLSTTCGAGSGAVTKARHTVSQL